MEASPCVRIEKRKYSAIQAAKAFKKFERHESPNKARIVEKPSIACIDLSRLNIALANTTQHEHGKISGACSCLRQRASSTLLKIPRSTKRLRRKSVQVVPGPLIRKRMPTDLRRRFGHCISSFKRGGLGLG
jgi:hypothetical protein